MVNYQISDLVARIKNARSIQRVIFEVNKTREIEEIVEVLMGAGYLHSYVSFDRTLELQWSHGPQEIKVISKPGRRVYKGWKELGSFREGLGQLLVRTSKGIMMSDEAIRARRGGEVLLKIY